MISLYSVFPGRLLKVRIVDFITSENQKTLISGVASEFSFAMQISLSVQLLLLILYKLIDFTINEYENICIAGLNRRAIYSSDPNCFSRNIHNLHAFEKFVIILFNPALS